MKKFLSLALCLVISISVVFSTMTISANAYLYVYHDNFIYTNDGLHFDSSGNLSSFSGSNSQAWQIFSPDGNYVDIISVDTGYYIGGNMTGDGIAFSSSPTIATGWYIQYDNTGSCYIKSLHYYTMYLSVQNGILTISTTPTYWNIENAEKGDVNGDGVVNEADVQLIRDVVTGAAEVDAYAYWRADMDENGNVSAVDYLLLKAKVQGII